MDTDTNNTDATDEAKGERSHALVGYTAKPQTDSEDKNDSRKLP